MTPSLIVAMVKPEMLSTLFKLPKVTSASPSLSLSHLFLPQLLLSSLLFSSWRLISEVVAESDAAGLFF